MDGKKKIDINASSIVGLKAELFRKQEAFKKERLQNANSSVKPKLTSKKPSIWSKKNAGVQSRAEKDKQLTSEEEDTLAKSQSILAAKAKLYEKMMSGETIPDESTNERFLVDFEKKAIDNIHKGRSKDEKVGGDDEEVMASVPTREEMMKNEAQEDEVDDRDIPPPASADEEWVDYVDTLGRSRRCMRKDLPQLINMDKELNPDKFREEEKKEKLGTESLPDLLSEDMYREMLRKKWEAEEEEAAMRGPGPVHYQNVKFDEVRDLGIGYFDFSRDETERQQQMESLQMLRDETVDQRARREQLKAKRKAAMQARLAKVKQRKKLKGEIPGIDDENEETGENELEKKDPIQERLVMSADMSYKMLKGSDKKDNPVREWDIGKDPNLWEEAKKKARDERLSEFAPPTMYFDSPQQYRQPPKSHQDKTAPNIGNLRKFQGPSPSSASRPSNSKHDISETSWTPSETDFSCLSSGGFQAYQSTRKPQTVSSNPNQASYTFKDNLTTQSTSSVVTPNQPDLNTKEVNEESIQQNLSYLRRQSHKK